MNVPYADLRKARRQRNYYRNLFWTQFAFWAIDIPAIHYHWSDGVTALVFLGIVLVGMLHSYAQIRTDEDRDEELGL